ncbi:hypothetical protein Tco_1426169 [Tanacetum coccineum]
MKFLRLCFSLSVMEHFEFRQELVHLDKWSSDTVKCTAEDMMSNNTWLDDILIFSKTQASMKFVPRVSKYQLLSDFTALEELVRGGAKVSACWKIGIYVDPSKFKVVRFGKPLRIEIRLNCQKNDITRLKQKSGRSAKIYDGVGDQLWYEKKIGVWLYTSYLTKMCSEGSRFYSQRSAFLVENHERARVVIELFSEYDCEICYHPSKANVVADALSRKERVKPNRIRAMNMTLQSSIKDRILAAQKVAYDEPTEMQRGMDELIKRRSDGALYYLDRIWVPLKGDVRTLIMDEAHKSKYSIHQELIRCTMILGIGVVRFGKKRKLAPRFVGPFEITKRIGLVAYRLRLPEELKGVHDTFHVSNLKKCLADPTLQIPLDEIQVDAKLNFIEEPMEILEREFKKLKRSRISIVKVRWNSKRGPEFT